MNAMLSQLPPLILVAAYTLFWGWEAVASARRNAGFRFRRARNMALTLVSFLLGGATGAALLWLSALVASRQWGLLALTHWSDWAFVIAGLLLLDMTDYWRHRLSHNLPILWRLHRVHHTDAAMDVTTTFRNHPIEMLLRPFFLAAAIAAFGIAPLAVLIQPLLQLPVLVFQHANVQLPPAIDRALAWLIVTPGMHLVHHSRAEPETNSNYATWLSLWDSLFFSRENAVPAAIGLDGHDTPRHQTLVGMLATPWR